MSTPRKPLPSERNTPAIEEWIMVAAEEKFGKDQGRAVFEHGHWWFCLENGAQYDVVDAEPGIAGTAFDFEEVTSAEED